MFAGLTAVLAKIGVSQVPSNVATLVRTVVVVVFAAGIVAASGQLPPLGRSPAATGWPLVLSGVATGLSWLFYFAALKHGPISGVAPIDKLSFVIAMILGFLVLKETVRPLTLVGAGAHRRGRTAYAPADSAASGAVLFEGARHSRE